MTWQDIKTEIQRELRSRNLADPDIRLRALDNLEKLLTRCYPNFKQKPEQLLKLGRPKVTQDLITVKQKVLNGAENSVLKQIFDLLSTGAIP